MNKNKINRESGLTIIELLVYLAIFSVVLGIVVQVMSGTFAIFANTKSLRSLNATGASIIERMSYNIRHSDGFGTTGNSYGSHPSSFSVRAIDVNLAETTYYYTLDSATGRLREQIDNNTAEYLNSPGQEVTNFVVKQITAGDTYGLNITFTITDNRVSPAQSATFTTTTLMRGTY